MPLEIENEVKDQFNTVLWDVCPIGLLFIRVDGSIIKANRAMPYILGYSETELVGKTWMQITHPDDLEPDQASVQTLLDGESKNYRMLKRYITKFGTIVWVIITVVIIVRRETTLGFLVFVEDIQKNMNITPEYVNDKVVFRPTISIKDFFKDNWKTLIPWLISFMIALSGFAYTAISDRIKIQLELQQLKEQISRKQ